MRDTTRQKYMDAMNRRADLMRQADEAFDAGNVESGIDFTNQAKELNGEIAGYQALMEEETRFSGKSPAVTSAEARELAEDRAETLKKGGTVSYSPKEIMGAMGFIPRNSLLLSEESLLMPTRISTTIRDGENRVSSILDQVSVMDLTGAQSYAVPMLTKDLTAYSGDPATLTGTERTASDAEFDYAELSAYEVNVTDFVDRNLPRLTNVDYEGQIRLSAMRAMRREITKLIFNGAGEKMLGVKTGKTAKGTSLVKRITVPSIVPGFLDKLIFGYGGDEEFGGKARLFLNKKDLAAIGDLRYEDNKRVYEIVEDADNNNTGRIIDGGRIVPYTIGSALTDYATASGSDISMVYGDPISYLLGLFGPYSLRVDESYMAGKRMNTILGDVFVGGNIVAPAGFLGVIKGG